MGMGIANGDISKEQTERDVHHYMRLIGLMKFAWLMKGWSEDEIDAIIEESAKEAQEIAEGSPAKALEAVLSTAIDSLQECDFDAERED